MSSNEDLIIHVENVSKRYELYDSPRDRLKQFILPPTKSLLGLERNNYFREFWALKDISLEISKGEAIGILGQNGSGKSTLLQIITGTLTPTSGQISTKGRVSALLELGAGFNPDFSGRENVYLNGALLGFSIAEIDAIFDDIAGFADIGEHLDQPVKTYSSGMMVRLAFAVQVQVEPDILIVDEALAVGDALFQKRCFQKIEKLLSNGVTLLFVSHDQESVRTLTNRALLLQEGRAVECGSSSEVVLAYRKQLHEEETRYMEKSLAEIKRKADHTNSQDTSIPSTARKASGGTQHLQFGSLDAEILSVSLFGDDGKPKSVFYPGETQNIQILARTNCPLNHLNVSIRLRNKEGVKIYSWGTLNQDMVIQTEKTQNSVFWEKQMSAGEEFTVNITHACPLGANLYELQVAISQEGLPYYGEQRMLHWIDEAAFFTIAMSQRKYFFGGVTDIRAKAEFS